MCFSRFAGPLLATVLATAGCQPLPAPFQPPDKTLGAAPLLLPGPVAGVTIAPLTGAPAAASRALGLEVAAALQAMEVAASAQSSLAGGWLLQGEARTRPLDARRDAVELRWRLVDPAGLASGETRQGAVLDRDAWAAGDPAALRPLALDSAAALERLIRAGQPAAPAPAALAIAPIEGAPGDGGRALARALRGGLLARGLEIAEAGGGEALPNTLTIRGRVRLSPHGTNQMVELDWTVHAADGEELGNVSQRNMVPGGSLDRRWGAVAEAAANAAADGIADLLRRRR